MRGENIMATNNRYVVKSLGKIDGLPVVKIQGSNKFDKLSKIIVIDSLTGEVVKEVTDFETTKEGNYFLKESYKKDSFLRGVLETRAGLPASEYAKNEVRIFNGEKRFRMSAYFYAWSNDRNTMYRYTYDLQAASGRVDIREKVAEFRGTVLYVYLKTPKTGKKLQGLNRTDRGGIHEEDDSARGALEAWRRDLLS